MSTHMDNVVTPQLINNHFIKSNRNNNSIYVEGNARMPMENAPSSLICRKPALFHVSVCKAEITVSRAAFDNARMPNVLSHPQWML